MDLTADIIYRGYKLNDSAVVNNIVPSRGLTSGISGSVVHSADFSDVDVVQYVEKRSLSDGSDTGDVYLGVRRLHMSGVLYGTTRALLYDAYWSMRTALSPTLAMRDSPADKGYQPLYFSTPTNRVAEFPLSAIQLRILAMPRADQAVFQSFHQGGNAADSLSIAWTATFLCRDPSIMGIVTQDYPITTSPTQTGNLVNRGSYLAPLNGLFLIGAAGGVITVVTSGSTATITMPASTGNRIIRYKGQDKLLTVEEASVELLRYDLIVFASTNTWALVPPGTTAYTITTSGVVLDPTSHIWFWESYA